MIELTIARFIAGIGAGALQLLAMIVSADIYSMQDRGLPQPFSNLSLAVGLGLGGPIGGILNDIFGWRIAFLCQVPPFVLVMVVVTNKLRYVTPVFPGSTLTWLSMKFNEDLPPCNGFGWFIHRTGKYTTLNLIFGILPLSGLIPIILMREDSGFIPNRATGALSSENLNILMFAESSIAFGTAVSQLFRGLGQISSVAIASAVFQSRLDTELHQCIHVPDAEKVSLGFPVRVICADSLSRPIPPTSDDHEHDRKQWKSPKMYNIKKIIAAIRHSLSLVGSLPPDLQHAARSAYAASLRTVFIIATCSMLVSYVLRFPWGPPADGVLLGRQIPEAKTGERSGSVVRTDVESESRSRPGAPWVIESESESRCEASRR
ncbi:hypothetical protein OG21DRAFT_1524415 [Imleria badia]|nr:hypothetical protein OG21DRAFT_1524415 [Imleria badia]